MSGTLSSTNASALAPYLQGAGTVASLGSSAYNIYNQYQNQQYQDKLRSLAQNPSELNAYAQQFTQPLNAGLTASVANQAQAYLAQRGLSDSPEISQQVEAQAIAPQIQQNQQAGYQNALQALGLGGGAISPGQQQQTSMAQLTKALSQLLQLGGQGGQQPGTLPSALPTPQTYATINAPSTIPDPYAGLGAEPAPIDMSSWYAANTNYAPASGADADTED